jgi:hypothetical protein
MSHYDEKDVKQVLLLLAESTHALAKELHKMTLDLSKLQAAIAQVSGDVQKLITADVSAAQAAAAQLAQDQALVDAIVPSVTQIATVAEAALNTPPAAPAPTA